MLVGLVGHEGSDTGTFAEFALPDVAKYAIDFMSKHWENNPHANLRSPPVLIYDVQQSHGPDSPGLIYTATHKINFPEPCLDAKEKVRVRVSFGIDRPFECQGDYACLPIDNPDRVHVSVAGNRGFFPQDYSAFSEDKRNLAACNEMAKLSLRWKRGEKGLQFDDYSGMSFHPERSSYILWRPPRGGICEEEDGQIKKYIEQVERREPLLFSTQGKSSDEIRKLSQSTKDVYDYGSVLELLARFGDVSSEDVARFSQMTPEQGANYLLENVLPAMENFVRA